MTRPSPIIQADDFADLDTAERLAFIGREFAGKVVATTSFGAQSAVLLHLLATHAPEIPIICVDTGYMFAETYVYAEELQRQLGISVRFFASPVSPARMEAIHGRLWQMGQDGLKQYGMLRKIEPLDRALKAHHAEAWISGVRRSHSDERSRKPFIEQQKRTTKIYPILDWTDEMVAAYIQTHALPPHPLVARGFVSIGDWHSTRKLEPGMKSEDTRHGGIQRECGLHLDSSTSDFQI